MKIHIVRNSETVRYAASELSKYLEMMGNQNISISYDDGDISLGLLSDFGLSEEGVLDPMSDDLVDVCIFSFHGYIAGSNDRSILFGVYDYLKSGGCMWIRPGKDGEYIPKRDMSSHSFTHRKLGDYAFRGECTEGAISYDHLRDTVEWLPKVNHNFFMIEQLVPYNYMNRWYSHECSTVQKAEAITFDEAAEYIALLEKDVKRCGLQLHAMGHGYFYEPYGIHCETNKTVYNVSDEAKQTMAMVNGKRGLNYNSPFHTQLCLSNTKARRDHINWLADYAEKKPYIDYLHVWLGDGCNNHCECDECCKRSISDWYVIFLNELDRELTQRNVKTKIAFIMYNETMWGPEQEKIANPDRFVLTVAIQARNYGKVLSSDRFAGKLPEYVHNKINYRLGCSGMMTRKDSWEQAFSGRSFIFDYRLYCDHYSDPSYMDVAEIGYKDCLVMSDMGFSGILLDKTQRSYFPTALPMAVMGEALFDKSLVYEDYLDKYFRASYGEGSSLARDYLDKVREFINPANIRVVIDVTYEDTGMGDFRTSGGVKGRVDLIPEYEKAIALADSFRAVSEQMASALTDPCVRKSWNLLVYHTEYVRRYAQFLIFLARNDYNGAKSSREDMLDFLSHMELEYSLDFDMCLFGQKSLGMLNQ